MEEIEDEKIVPNQTDTVDEDDVYDRPPTSYCKACNLNVKDTSQNPNSILCSDCREHFIKYPIPKWLYIVMAVVVIICGISFYRVPTLISDYKNYKSAESSYNQKNQYGNN